MSGLHIKRFVDRLQHFETRGAKDFTCPLSDAKYLHAEITKLLLDLEDLRSKQPSNDGQLIEVEMHGGSF